MPSVAQREWGVARAVLKRESLHVLPLLATAGPNGVEGRDEMLASGLFRALSAALTATAPSLYPPAAVSSADGAAAPPEHATRAHVARGVCCGVLAMLRACMLETEAEAAKSADAPITKPFLNVATEAIARLWLRHGGCHELQRGVLELAARLAAAPAAHAALTATLPLSEASAVAASGALRPCFDSARTLVSC